MYVSNRHCLCLGLCHCNSQCSNAYTIWRSIRHQWTPILSLPLTLGNRTKMKDIGLNNIYSLITMFLFFEFIESVFTSFQIWKWFWNAGCSCIHQLLFQTGPSLFLLYLEARAYLGGKIWVLLHYNCWQLLFYLVKVQFLPWFWEVTIQWAIKTFSNSEKL